MFSYFEGKLTEKTPAYAVVECNGIGYFLNISINTYTDIKDLGICKLFSHLVVKEDGIALYGFSTSEELELFKKLISVSGVGPNTARMVLSSSNIQEITEAIMTANVSRLKSIKGIGEKTAQRIIVDLKDKIKNIKNIENVKGIFESENNIKKTEALSALIMLGFNKSIAEKALDKVLSKSESNISIEDIIKKSLQIL